MHGPRTLQTLFHLNCAIRLTAQAISPKLSVDMSLSLRVGLKLQRCYNISMFRHPQYGSDRERVKLKSAFGRSGGTLAVKSI